MALARRSRGLDPRVCAATEIAVPDGSFGDSSPAFARLVDLLIEPTWHDASARVVIADPWARFGIIPPPPSRLDSAGRAAHARYVLADTYGEGITDWHLVLEDGLPGRSCVACAMPEPLQAALLAVLLPPRLRLVSMQPQLVVAYNAWRTRLPRDDAWFVTLQEGWLSAVRLANGAWDRVHTARLSGEPSVELDRLQAFGRLSRAAGNGGRLFVEAPPGMRQRAKRIGTEFEWLETAAAQGPESHELALLMRAGA